VSSDTQAQHSAIKLFFLLLALCLGVLFWGVSVGSAGFFKFGFVQSDPILASIVLDIRLPRTLGALCCGGLLGLSGALAQGLFRNPLADPYLLGSASGATLGVALALVAFRISPGSSDWLTRLGLTGAAFIGATAAVLLTLALARGFQHTLRLLLCGIVVGVLLGALCSLTLLLEPEVLQSMQIFMLGSTSYIGWNSVGLMFMGWLICVSISIALGLFLDGLSLGESTAISLGFNISPMRALLIVVLALAVGLSVAQTGLIGFVGLVSPHLVRSMVKVTHAHLLFLSSWMGAALLGVADILARCLIAPRELPVGVLTAVLGGGYLLWLMQKRQFSRAGGEL